MDRRPMFERILLPLDGSTTAETILSQAYRILKRRDSEVLLLRVAEAGGEGGTRAGAEEYVRGLEEVVRGRAGGKVVIG